MKKAILTIFILSSLFTLNAQIAGSKYKGSMNIPSPAAVIWSFTKDTAYLINVEDGNNMTKNDVIETMSYTLKDNILTIKKISGLSDCEEAVGKYKLELKDDKMFVTLIDDPCSNRSYAFNKDPFIKQN